MDGQWSRFEGKIPDRANEIYVNFRPTRRGEFQDSWADGKSTHFSRKTRQMLQNAMKKAKDKLGVTLTELYSPPRINPHLERMGHPAGTCFDLDTGWDLGDPKHREAMWRRLREERPEVILACPPCTAFSRMQALNWSRMQPHRKVELLKIGREHLELAVAVLKWQLKRGGAILFEHPDGATSWQEPELQSLASLTAVKTVICDQCMFGMNVDGTGLNRKRTKWLSNMPQVLEELEVKCDKNHFHVPLENGKPRLAQRYPERLQSRGSREEEEEDEDQPGDSDPLQECGRLRANGGGKEGCDEGAQSSRPSTGQRVHPILESSQSPWRIGAMGIEEVRVRCLPSEETSQGCSPYSAAQSLSTKQGPGTGPFLRDGKQTVPVLNIVDWGTNYQMCEALTGKNPLEVWEAYQATWARTFGHPEVITCDAGREFLGEFIQRATAEGIVVHQIASKAPWQQGKTERHGGHFKELLDKARSEVVVQSFKDLKQLMAEVEQAKNRYSNRSGFAPIQRQIGQWPRVPTSILSDEAIDPTLLNGVLTDDIERLHHMRTVAHKAFCEVNAKNTLKKALRARPRVWTDYKPGEYVFVFRVPRLKKRKHGGIVDDASISTKARWVGPGIVIAPDGANLWISMMGELWKVAREQCRPATTDEKTGIEAVVQECQELIDEFKRGSHRTGYKDITEEEFPPELEEAEGSGDDGIGERERAADRQRAQFQDPVDTIEYVPEYMDEDDATGPPEALPKRRRSVHEPEQEEPPVSRAASESSRSEKKHHPGFPQGVPETPPVMPSNIEPENLDGLNPQLREALRQSEMTANRLDGIPGPVAGPIYRWQQRAGQHGHLAPYLHAREWFLAEEEEQIEEEAKIRQHGLHHLRWVTDEKDKWTIDWNKGEVTRHHLRKMTAKFDPRFNADLPIPLNLMTENRKTHVRRENSEKIEEDSWTEPITKHEEKRWKGKTIFYIKNVEEARNYVGEKKGQDEVSLARESPQDQEEWKLSDLSEWNKVTQSGAVQVLDLETSRQVRQELRSQGQEDRILPTKIARRYKPGEQPGEPAVKKSRLCIRGDLDPDILDLERFSPTLNTVNFSVLLQIAANEGMKATVGDLKNAFCQSQPLERPKGRLYFQQPKEGVIGLHPEQIVMIMAGCYGLVDAPLHLTEDLKNLGYEMSALDPCIMKLYDRSRKKLLGAIAIEVDDLFTVGHQEHHASFAPSTPSASMFTS